MKMILRSLVLHERGFHEGSGGAHRSMLKPRDENREGLELLNLLCKLTGRGEEPIAVLWKRHGGAEGWKENKLTPLQGFVLENLGSYLVF